MPSELNTAEMICKTSLQNTYLSIYLSIKGDSYVLGLALFILNFPSIY